jgi:glycerol-3-phosphate acyltransferase PlsY
MAVLCGVAALSGHVWPIYLGFRGGKGVATSAGVIFAMDWMAGLAGLGVWGLVFAGTRTVSLASMAAAIAIPVAEHFTGARLWRPDPHGPITIFCGMAAVLVLVRHRENIARWRAGTEPRFTLHKEP